MHDIEKMITDIDREVAYTCSITGRNELDKRVMNALRHVPRNEFVPEALQRHAFANGPLPIGYSQTISQPYIVALMTDLLQTDKADRILEIGTGSGYQAAVLSQLVRQVYTVERVRELGEVAAKRLKKLAYTNIETRIGNGYLGWPEQAPYDGIIVTAAATHIPQALMEQLQAGGRLVIPVGMPYARQKLMLVEKDKQGNKRVEEILGVAFVPMLGE